MGSQDIRPQTLEERLIYWTIVGTWGIWLVGGLYLVGSVLGYALLGLLGARIAGVIETPPGQLNPIPATVLLWMVGMLTMVVTLVAAHISSELGMAQVVKSLFGWLKGWALLGIFPLIGAVLPIRPLIIYRATTILALQTLALAPIFFLAKVVGLPATVYVSPLMHLLGAGQLFFDVTLYAMDEVTGAARWKFYAPWATAAAFLAGLSLILSLQERSLWRRAIGVVSAVVVCYMAGSRLSIVALPAVLLSVLILSNLSRPITWGLLAFAGTLALLFSTDLIESYEDATDSFNAARAASSRVRAALGNIAVHRWMTEAPWFGHGVLERGGHVVELMPIGSHHTWWGLLFVKGAVGFAALAIPMAASLISLIARAQMDRVARAALGVIFSMLVFSLGDNLEIIAYMFWPSMTLLGIALRRPFRNPIVYADSTRRRELELDAWVPASR